MVIQRKLELKILTLRMALHKMQHLSHQILDTLSMMNPDPKEKPLDLKEEITGGISVCRHEQDVSLLTCDGDPCAEGEGEVPVRMILIQYPFYENHYGTV